MFRVVICILLLFIYMYIQREVDQLPRLGKRELICLLLFTCNYVVSVWRGFLFLWVLGMGYVILLWHSLSLPYYYLYGASLGRGNQSLYKWSRSHDQDGRHTHVWYRPFLARLHEVQKSYCSHPGRTRSRSRSRSRSTLR